MFAGAGELQYHGLQPAPGRPLHAGRAGRGPGRCDTRWGRGGDLVGVTLGWGRGGRMEWKGR